MNKEDHEMSNTTVSRHGLIAALLGLAAVLTGCDAPIAYYSLDPLYLDKQAKAEDAEVTFQQSEDINTALTAFFGTPDEPFVPRGSEMDKVIDADALAMAAGPVGSDEFGRAHGLYREHCVHCHGINGDGKGPTAAFLNPYPRDYRRGVFKFKSTPRGSRPTHADLKKTLVNGVAGTSMPSFKLLSETEIESLVNYVKYLSMRGEAERALIEYTTSELDEETRLFDPENLAESGELFLEEIIGGVVAKWVSADEEVTEVPARPEMDDAELLASIKRGRSLFYGSVANCVKCHGESQLGDGQVDDYDDWVKDYADAWIKADPEEKDAKWEAIAKLDSKALKPRNIIPRNLRSGIYRGGRRPVDLFWRIHDGIDGTPMPAAMMRQPGSSTGLTPDDLWDIVNYVHSLPYEVMSTTGEDEPVYSRPRM